MTPHHIEILGTVLFALAVIHTFSIKIFHDLAHRMPHNSIRQNFFELVGELEIVFGFWAGLMLMVLAVVERPHHVISFLETVNFTEPAFVFVIMTVASTRPVLDFARMLINGISRLLPLPAEMRFFSAALIFGPLLGSFITEPAAMTVTALLLFDRIFTQPITSKFRYATIGLLFVNVSIGGVLTSYAAPPVLMVASKWGWDSHFMFLHFGWKAILAVTANTLLFAFAFRKDLKVIAQNKLGVGKNATVPHWIQGVHLLFLAAIVLTAHHMVVFMGVFLFFIGWAAISKEFQDELKIRESLLVGFFLGGLVIFGGYQRWWLEPVLNSLTPFPLFLGTTALTAVTDNAALTYLGSLVPNVSEAFKHALVEGAVAGGGLTIIANAPNPAGFAILRESFEPEGFSARKLLLGALIPTVITMTCLWLLPSL